MNTFARRQRLMALLHDQPELRVPEIAVCLKVSQGTVRNDLNALAHSGHIIRVHGGASLNTDGYPQSAAFTARAQINQNAKHTIARQVAERIEDGDSLLLDASTTVYHLAQYLQERQRLTVVTNGVEVARSLAKNPSNTVILLGGVLRPDGTSVAGLLSERLLQDLHIKTACVSCTGFTLEAGLTEVDLQEALLKSRMIHAAGRVLALIDSSKFGKVDLTAFADVKQVAAIYTDNQLDARWIENLRQAGVPLVQCDP